MRSRVLLAALALALLAPACLITKPLDDGWTEYRGQPKRVNQVVEECHPSEKQVIKSRESALGTSTVVMKDGDRPSTEHEIGMPVPGWKVVRVRGCTECLKTGQLCGQPYQTEKCCSGECGWGKRCE